MSAKRFTTSAVSSISKRVPHRIGRARLASLAALAMALALPISKAAGQGSVFFAKPYPHDALIKQMQDASQLF